MCGIVGFVKSDCLSDLFGALHTLEYRGYDSSGMAYFDASGSLRLKKCVGRVDRLRHFALSHHADVAMGHTRWATHGAPTKVNAHPHVAGQFALVHNGIISNYASLLAELKGQGVRFTSQTDTEVIVRLLDWYGASATTADEVLSAIRRTISRLEGSFAVALLCASTPHNIYLFKRHNPLIVGQGQGFFCFASDTPALVKHTPSIFKMEDGDIALLGVTGARFWHGETPFTPAFSRTSLAADMVDKGRYPAYMAKEMAEIPMAMQATQKAMDALALPTLRLAEADTILLVGCGTAYHACLYADFLLERARVRTICTVASEFRATMLSGATVMVAVSQSGETADTLSAARLAKALGAYVVAITNVPYSALYCLADYPMLTAAGAEIAVAATKSYNTQLVALRALVAGLCHLDGVQSWQALSGAVYVGLSKLDALAAKRYDNVVLLGKGRDYNTCLEGCLKIKEIVYCRCETGYSGEIKHGPLACVTRHSLVVLVCTDSCDVDKNLTALHEVASRGAHTLAITPYEHLASRAKYAFLLPTCEDSLYPALSIQPLQYMAYRMAVARRLDPDKPRHLAKSVTVE